MGTIGEERGPTGPETDGDKGTLRRRLAQTRPLTLTLAGGVIVGLAATLLYSVEVRPIWRVLASSAMFAAASLAGGGLLGVLFGVPRSMGSEPRSSSSAGQAPAVPLPGIGANTNLEQISDWLTKIIVGVSLTQLATIKDGAVRLFDAMAPALGGPPGGAAFAGAVVIYFSVLGFFAGWFYARLRLGVAMSYADALLDFSRRAERAGDRRSAQAAKTAAAATISGVAAAAPAAEPSDINALINRYERLRATMPAGSRRTSQMEDLVREARELARSGSLTAQDVRGMFQIGREGGRIIALGLMEGALRLADFPSVLAAITSSLSAFEQYHALYVANLMVASLSADERSQLQEALQREAVRGQMGEDFSRTTLAEQILTRIEARPDAGGQERPERG
jgi:hypothetical protein